MQADAIGIFGEVLFDSFADGSRILGGAPFNVAWHLQAFAQQPVFISRIGLDQPGDEIRRAMREWGMAGAGLQTDHLHPTGAVAVTLAAGEPHYEILADQAYDFIDAEQLPTELNCRLLYHGTLALRHDVSRRALNALNNGHQGQVFLDVNLRTPWWQAGEVEQWLAEADWVKLNFDELELLQPSHLSLAERMANFNRRFDLQGSVVTLGEQGASALLADGEMVCVRPEGQVDVVDCVGAGDAFAAVLMLGVVKAWPLSLTMRRAQSFASALVGRRGATVLERAFYKTFADEWGLA